MILPVRIFFVTIQTNLYRQIISANYQILVNNKLPRLIEKLPDSANIQKN